ncbi:hypothetical protein Calag_0995 [Caldisphaera lagunensis DSM 15908]|uniref:ABC-2 type transporter n=1 Tax=Caldisphaera lagunensis (strain DSM 15908 / JCM 11604 / ANMR 0165 / IC-154) TaxID=1056495 RepID=L0A9Z3_CALLD|nr:hypothetical protein [Caldisphaera lagunensis]AFZ70718.1 hypothetical protein Calag_0995 [Caldisphaera lagunensis DSM 15908]
MSIKKSWELALIDLYDSLRPPSFDIMLILVSALSGILSVLEPVTTPPAVANAVLGAVLFVTSLYLALRASSDLVNLVQTGVMPLYLTYPISRRESSLIIYLTRVFIPSLILLGIPAIVSGVMLYPVVGRNIGEFLIMWVSYLIQAQLYGSIFILASIKTKSSGTSAVISITGYFGFTVTSIILALIGSLNNIEILTKIANSMGLYNVVYDMITKVSTPLWEIFVVPLIFLALFITYIIYFTRRFEP